MVYLAKRLLVSVLALALDWVVFYLAWELSFWCGGERAVKTRARERKAASGTLRSKKEPASSNTSTSMQMRRDIEVLGSPCFSSDFTCGLKTEVEVGKVCVVNALSTSPESLRFGILMHARLSARGCGCG